ncbi:hypothetical protein ECC02_010911 [Trypanosoma cruzi]|uniref:Uncharacterized protein n=1 Tax=Trypanosoma cruzi TaxID=5693 RepID=A0A7J6XM08_TRYCR|nr:hypothetical protein ECC02_011856 [Trypanosoma cruzi]KAF5216331.1 hypothetical protein ECC02_010911 [Trypanosoma cruzi]
MARRCSLMLHCFEHHSRHLSSSHDRAAAMPTTAQPAASYSCPPPSSYRHASETYPVRCGAARRGTRAASALRRRRAVSLHAPGPPRHMLNVRKQMSVERQSTVSDQLLLLGLHQLLGAARSHKQQEKTQSHRPGHCGIPRQVPYAIQVFPEGLEPNGDVLFHLPHLRQSLLPVLCHKPRAKNRYAATVWLASPKPPEEPAPHCSTSQAWPSAPRPAPIPGDTRGVFSAPPKAPPRNAQESNDGTSTSTHLPHQLLPLRVHPRQVLHVCSYTFFPSGIRSSSRH